MNQINKRGALGNVAMISESIIKGFDTMDLQLDEHYQKLHGLLRESTDVLFKNISWLIKYYDDVNTPYNVIMEVTRYILEMESDIDFLLSHKNWRGCVDNLFKASDIFIEAKNEKRLSDVISDSNFNKKSRIDASASSEKRVLNLLEKYNFAEKYYYNKYCWFAHFNVLGILGASMNFKESEKMREATLNTATTFSVCYLLILQSQDIFPTLKSPAAACLNSLGASESIICNTNNT